MSHAKQRASQVMPYCYSVHGATLVTEFECSELAPSSARSAVKPAEVVRICEGDAPRLADPSFSGARCWSTSTEFRIEVDGVATYYVRDAKEVIVQRHRSASQRDVCTFLYDAPFAALSLQAGMMPLRGSAIEVDGCATVILGQPGAGKSTLAARLVRRGCRLVGDGVICVAQDDKGQPVVLPGISSLQLWWDAIELLGDSPALYARVRDRLERFFVRVSGERVCSAPVRVESVLLLDVWNDTRVSVSALRKLLGTGRIMEQASQFRMFGGAADMVFERCAALAEEAHVLELKRPAGGDTLAALDPLISEGVAR